MSGTEPQPAVWPPAVRQGDRVGVAALSGAAEPAAVEAGLTALRDLGYEPVPARNLTSRWGIFAGSEQERLDAFHELIADDSLGAVVFLRGGYGLMRLLPDLDWDLVGRQPRAWVGYSDLTPFLLEVTRRFGLVTFHGPMVATDVARRLDAAEAASFCGALAGEAPAPIPVRFLREGEAEGPLLGGCLSLLEAVAGTPWEPNLAGSLLFLEDVGEPAYRIDRMLTHLRLSGTLSKVRAIVAGHFGPAWESDAIRDAVAPWHRETLLAAPGPVAFGVPCGHGIPNLTLPLGAWARLDAASGTLTFARSGANR
jgi:muramoyltetrapeptide carboxypeptidase